MGASTPLRTPAKSNKLLRVTAVINVYIHIALMNFCVINSSLPRVLPCRGTYLPLVARHNRIPHLLLTVPGICRVGPVFGIAASFGLIGGAPPSWWGLSTPITSLARFRKFSSIFNDYDTALTFKRFAVYHSRSSSISGSLLCARIFLGSPYLVG